MSHSPSAPGASETPAGSPPGSSPAGGPPRRAVLLGGLIGGAAGLVGGAATGLALGRKSESVVEPSEPDEAETERKAALNPSYAQFGEDLVLKSLFDYIGTPNPTYLDIGTFEPIRLNNTYLFYGRGRGVLVEPNVDLSDKIRRLRPSDTLVVAGIGVSDQTEADYYVMTAPGLNTFDRDQVARVERTTPERLVRVVKVPLLGINRVIAEHFGGAAPDLISIDIEGMDFAVLRTLDFARFRPKVICAETVVFASLDHLPDTPRLLAEKGYELRGMTHANVIFVDKTVLKPKDKG